MSQYLSTLLIIKTLTNIRRIEFLIGIDFMLINGANPFDKTLLNIYLFATAFILIKMNESRSIV